MQQAEQQLELAVDEMEIPNETFEDRVWQIRRALSFTFSALSFKAEITVTDGKQSARFSLGRNDYDLDDGCLRNEPIPTIEVHDLQTLIAEIAKPTQSTWRNPATPKGIVPLNAEVEEMVEECPGIELRIEGVMMPYGQGKRVNYYSGRIER